LLYPEAILFHYSLENQSSLEVILRVIFMSFCFDIEPLFNYWIATSLRSSQQHLAYKKQPLSLL